MFIEDQANIILFLILLQDLLYLSLAKHWIHLGVDIFDLHLNLLVHSRVKSHAVVIFSICSRSFHTPRVSPLRRWNDIYVLLYRLFGHWLLDNFLSFDWCGDLVLGLFEILDL